MNPLLPQLRPLADAASQSASGAFLATDCGVTPWHSSASRAIVPSLRTEQLLRDRWPPEIAKDGRVRDAVVGGDGTRGSFAAPRRISSESGTSRRRRRASGRAFDGNVVSFASARRMSCKSTLGKAFCGTQPCHVDHLLDPTARLDHRLGQVIVHAEAIPTTQPSRAVTLIEPPASPARATLARRRPRRKPTVALLVLSSSPLHLMSQTPLRRLPSFAHFLQAQPCLPQPEHPFRTAKEVTQSGVHNAIVGSEHPQRLTGNPPVEQRLIGHETTQTTKLRHDTDPIVVNTP